MVRTSDVLQKVSCGNCFNTSCSTSFTPNHSPFLPSKQGNSRAMLNQRLKSSVF